MRQRRRCDRELTICSLLWLGPVVNEELDEEDAHDNNKVNGDLYSALTTISTTRFTIAVYK